MLISTCKRVSESGSGKRIEFMVENMAEMKEIAPLGRIYSLAERRAVAGIYRCSGVERFQSGLFDRTDRLAGLKESEARIVREVQNW